MGVCNPSRVPAAKPFSDVSATCKPRTSASAANSTKRPAPASAKPLPFPRASPPARRVRPANGVVAWMSVTKKPGRHQPSARLTFALLDLLHRWLDSFASNDRCSQRLTMCGQGQIESIRWRLLRGRRLVRPRFRLKRDSVDLPCERVRHLGLVGGVYRRN
jgi:hypothetical protein